jgi:N-acetylglucosaminyl-diphospho-decaprenol L-rhamnosyltransferase
MNPKRKLAIIVVNYGSHELLETNIAPVSSHTPDASVVVVDNYTSDRERESVASLVARKGWTMVAPDTNLGFGCGMNLGVEAAAGAGAQAFLLINPDATLDRSSLDMLREAVEQSPMTVVAPRIVRSDGSVWFAGAVVRMDDGETKGRRHASPELPPGERRWLTGACLLMSLEVWQASGGFDHRYFLYWEDVDFSFRVEAAGGALAVLEEATAVHDEGGTQGSARGSRAKSPTYYYYNIRNRLLFAAIHLDPEGRRRWKGLAIPAAWRILLRGGRRQFLRPVSPVWAAVRGTWDGLTLLRRWS